MDFYIIGVILIVIGTTNLNNLSNIVKVFNNNHAFACLDEKDKLFCWGDQNEGGNTPDISNNISNVFSTIDAFCGLTKKQRNFSAWEIVKTVELLQ